VPEPPIPLDLLAGPEGPLPVLPPETALLELPFGGLGWQDFERLCLRLADAEADAEESSRYGTPGQDQGGIDIYSRLRAGGYCVYQCKKYETLYPSDIREAVRRLLEGPWADRAGRLTFCTSHSCVATERREVIEEQAALLRTRDHPIALTVWDAERLSLLLQDHPSLVRLFFGADAVRRFNPLQYELEQAASLAAVIARYARPEVPAPQIIDVSWGRPMLRDAYRGLSSDGLRLVLAILGESPSAQTVAGVAAHPSSVLLDAGSAEWKVVALEAERTGEWVGAARAWDPGL